MELKPEQFTKAVGASAQNAARYFDHAVAAMERFGIDTPAQVSAFLANISIETARLTKMEEDLYYTTPERLADLFRRVFDTDKNGVISADEIDQAKRYLRNPKMLSQALYGGYHGRGGAHLTWERNYALHGLKLGTNYLAQPEQLLEPEHAMLSAASFWDEIKGNEVASNMGEITRRWNGPRRLHLAERIAQRDVALTVLA